MAKKTEQTVDEFIGKLERYKLGLEAAHDAPFAADVRNQLSDATRRIQDAIDHLHHPSNVTGTENSL